MTISKTLAAGRQYLAIPGPSVIPDAVLQAMHRAAPNIYAGELVDMTHSVVVDLRRVARTAQHVAIYIANGHGAWEAALSNVIGPGDRVLVPATGRFGHGWADMCAGLGAEAEVIDFGRASTFDLDRVGEALKADTAHRYKAVLATHVDTSSSVRNDIAALRALMDECGHPALLMVDCIASLGCDRFEMDDWGVDVMVSACQKGLMVPPGVSFVWFSDKAAEARAGLARVSRYWDWAPRANPAEYYQHFGGTAPTHHIFGLRAALDLILAEGMEQVWARHAHLARAVWAAGEVWGQEGPFRLNISDPALRSHAVTAARIGAPQGTALREWVSSQIGLTLGIGLGMAAPDDPAWHGFFRLGHMGHVNGQMIMGMLGGIETGLNAIGVPHGKGGLEAAAKVLGES